MKREVVVLAVLAIFSLICLAGSIQIYQESPGGNSPGIFPLLASAGMAITCVVAIFQARRSRPEFSEEEAAEPNPQGWEGVKIALITEIPFTVFVMIVATILYAVAMSVIGFYISTAIYLCFSIIFLYHGTHIRRAVCVTVGFLVAIYVIIDLVFQVHMP
ncbi:MAG: tripartite tricarboxylate transporter TctB family protein [Lachnospiraceae bacterium]|nr:tripartite tricarboxylate transporter TctB family protein [Lachnospiraceae bacterium]